MQNTRSFPNTDKSSVQRQMIAGSLSYQQETIYESDPGTSPPALDTSPNVLMPEDCTSWVK